MCREMQNIDTTWVQVIIDSTSTLGLTDAQPSCISLASSNLRCEGSWQFKLPWSVTETCSVAFTQAWLTGVDGAITRRFSQAADNKTDRPAMPSAKPQVEIKFQYSVSVFPIRMSLSFFFFKSNLIFIYIWEWQWPATKVVLCSIVDHRNNEHPPTWAVSSTGNKWLCTHLTLINNQSKIQKQMYLHKFMKQIALD